MTEVKTRKKEVAKNSNQQPLTTETAVTDPELIKQKLLELREHFNTNYHN